MCLRKSDLNTECLQGQLTDPLPIDEEFLYLKILNVIIVFMAVGYTDHYKAVIIFSL